MDTQARVAENVERLRNGKGWSLTQLSEKLAELGHDIPIDGLSKLERGKRRILVQDVEAFARAFDTTTTRLFMDPASAATDELLQLWDQYEAAKDAQDRAVRAAAVAVEAIRNRIQKQAVDDQATREALLAKLQPSAELRRRRQEHQRVAEMLLGTKISEVQHRVWAAEMVRTLAEEKG